MAFITYEDYKFAHDLNMCIPGCPVCEEIRIKYKDNLIAHLKEDDYGSLDVDKDVPQ